jgi:serine/threonine protein kinase
MKSELTGIGSWRLLEVLGTGEHATVYRALDASALGAEARPKALKVLHGALAQDEREVEAFIERAGHHARLARIDHAQIVTCHGVHHIGGRPFAVLDLVDAVSLERLFPERGRPKFSIDAATNLLLGVLDALSAAAHERVVHGRLGASDVLVHADGSVMLTGFGKDGPPRADFLAIHRLAQSLGAPWLPEVDAWLDQLASESPPWKDVRGARAAFPLAYTEAGKKALDRSVRGRRKKDQKATSESEPTPSEPIAARPRSRRAPRQPLVRSREEATAALRQARAVTYSAGAIIGLGFIVELISR